jgi:acyl-CoA thioester hydrolase
MPIFNHKVPIQIRFKDTDQMGHVNNANFFTYIETARISYFNEALGSSVEWRKQDGVILARVEIDYRRPILFEDNICVYTRCSRIGTKSLDLNWVIAENTTQLPFNPEKNKASIFAEGTSVLVAFDYTQQKSVVIPAERKKKLEAFEQIKL